MDITIVGAHLVVSGTFHGIQPVPETNSLHQNMPTEDEFPFPVQPRRCELSVSFMGMCFCGDSEVNPLDRNDSKIPKLSTPIAGWW